MTAISTASRAIGGLHIALTLSKILQRNDDPKKLPRLNVPHKFTHDPIYAQHKLGRVS
jgi:hypothetical protein